MVTYFDYVPFISGQRLLNTERYAATSEPRSVKNRRARAGHRIGRCSA
jgi:hypothetical protein